MVFSRGREGCLLAYERHGGICNEWAGTLNSNGVGFVSCRVKKKRRNYIEL